MHKDWHEALDIQMDTQKWCMQDFGIYYNMRFVHSVFSGVTNWEPNEDECANIVHHLVSSLYRADTLFITSEMMHVLLQAAHDLPDDVVFDERILISRRGFCVFEEPIKGTDRQKRSITIHAVMWEAELVQTVLSTDEPSMCIMLYFFTDPHDLDDDYNNQYIESLRESSVPIPPLALAHIYPAMDGTPLPVNDQEGAELIVGICKMFMAMQYLAQQTIGEPMQMRAPRHVRKRAVKWDRDNERYITLITLRRKSVKKDDHEPEHIERTHRWIVRGHWRRQYYPKTKTHDWKYIYEHIKGPEDKPLLISERRIFNFRR